MTFPLTAPHRLTISEAAAAGTLLVRQERGARLYNPLAQGLTGQVLVSRGPGRPPQWGNLNTIPNNGTEGQILVYRNDYPTWETLNVFPVIGNTGDVLKKTSTGRQWAAETFLSSPAYGITATNISNWNTAYAWGDHSTNGYLTTVTAATWLAANHENTYNHAFINAGSANQLLIQTGSGPTWQANLTYDGSILKSEQYGAISGSVVLVPTGTNGLQLGTGGNARGQYAVDLQLVRNANTQVASGNYSVILGGERNTSSGNYSVTGGSSSTATGLLSICIGSTCSASGDYSIVLNGTSHNCSAARSCILAGTAGVIDSNTSYSAIAGCATCSITGSASAQSYYDAIIGASVCSINYARFSGIVGGSGNQINGIATSAINYCGIVGGLRNNISANYGAIVGGLDNNVTATLGTSSGYYASSSKYGQVSKASGRFATVGDAQISTLVARRQTTNATPVALFLDGSSTRLIVPEGSTYGFTIKVVARQTNDDFSVARYVFEGVITRNTGGNVTMADVVKTYEHEDDSDWDCAVTANVTNQDLLITVTGKADNNINWVARIELEETF